MESGEKCLGLDYLLRMAEPAGCSETPGHSSEVYTRGSQMGDTWPCLEETFLVVTLGWGMLLASSGWEPEMLLSTL